LLKHAHTAIEKIGLKILFVIYLAGIFYFLFSLKEKYPHAFFTGVIILSVRFLAPIPKSWLMDYQWEATVEEDGALVKGFSYLACRKVLLWFLAIAYYNVILHHLDYI